MLLFDKGYSYLKQRYIVPLSHHSVNYRSLKTHNIKNALKHAKYSSVDNIGPSHFIFAYDEDIILPALLGDLWMCYIRAWVQKDAAQKGYSLFPDYCPNWSIVSDYYSSFYCASTLLRLTMRGTIYFDSSIKKTIESNISELLGSPYALKENYIYTIDKDESREGVYNLELKPSVHQTHETVWNETAEIIRIIAKESSHASDEDTFLQYLTSVLHTLKNTFPSKLRNAVNYQLPYGIEALEKKIFPSFACRPSTKWISNIMNFDGRRKYEPVDQIRLYDSYAKYIDALVNNLVYEYYDIQGRQCGIQKAINKNRRESIVFPSATYVYNS